MLNNIGFPEMLVIGLVVLVIFGKGKVSSLMGEVGKGISAFKKGMAEPVAPAATEAAEATPVALLEAAVPAPDAQSAPRG